MICPFLVLLPRCDCHRERGGGGGAGVEWTITFNSPSLSLCNNLFYKLTDCDNYSSFAFIVPDPNRNVTPGKIEMLEHSFP